MLLRNVQFRAVQKHVNKVILTQYDQCNEEDVHRALRVVTGADV